jgi:hypothetical protein
MPVAVVMTVTMTFTLNEAAGHTARTK